MKKIFYLGIMASMSMIYSCKNDITPAAPDKGYLNLTKYVAIGNSLTAGYADGSLTRSGQEASYPSILAQQFAKVGGGSFNQPLLLDNAGFPSLKKVLGYKADCKTGEIVLSTIPFAGTVNPDNANNISTSGPFNNIGIPGIRVLDYGYPGYFSINPYSKRFVHPDDYTKTATEYAIATAPTFFTCWLGNNDVLGFAVNGGEGSISGNNPKDITPVASFKFIYDQLIAGLTANGAKGVLINIPDVTSVPLFNTIPAMGLKLETQEQVLALNSAYAPLGITFEIGNNPFIIADNTAPGGMRKIKAGELIILSAMDSIKCGGWGSLKPIPDSLVLNSVELDNINKATADFNNIIKEAAVRHSLAFFDANTYMKSLSSGMVWNGVKLNTTYVSGGLFSLDGVHLTPRGYALVANELIKVINQKYSSTIGSVDINQYPAMIFP